MLTDEVQNADSAPMGLQDVFPEGLSLRVLNTTRRYSENIFCTHCSHSSPHDFGTWTEGLDGVLELRAWTQCLKCEPQLQFSISDLKASKANSV